MQIDTWITSVPCLCGKGTIDTEHWSDDYRSGTGPNTLNCPACDVDFCIQGSRVVRKADAERAKVAHDIWWRADEALLNSDWVRDLLHRALELLRSFPTVAATYRCLDAHGLAGGSLRSFYKEWDGGRCWVERRHAFQLLSISRMLGGQDDGRVVPEIAKLDALRAAIPKVPVYRHVD